MKTILIYLVGVVIVLTVAIVGWMRFSAPQQVACTTEAKLCSDGSAVGRSGPNCEFAACPAPVVNPSWKTFTDSERGISFRYPEVLDATYVHAYDWPPKVVVTDGPYTCLETGPVSDRGGSRERRMVSGRAYCVTKESGAAAGSTYTQYVYAAERGPKVWIFTESLQIPQCANYDDPQRVACQKEQEAFDFDSVMDRIIQSATVR